MCTNAAKAYIVGEISILIFLIECDCFYLVWPICFKMHQEHHYYTQVPYASVDRATVVGIAHLLPCMDKCTFAFSSSPYFRGLLPQHAVWNNKTPR